MSDDFLTRHRKAPRREFEAALYQRISKPMDTQPKLRGFRTFALSIGAVAALITATLIASPQARALADDVWRQVGSFIFVQGTEDGCTDPKTGTATKPCSEGEKQAEKQAQIDQGATEPAKDSGAPPRRQPFATAPDAAGASEIIGFTVLTPAYIPDGFTPETQWEIVDMGNGTIEARFHYLNGEGEWLVIGEAKYDPNSPPSTIVRPEVADATVNGIPAVWLPGDKATLIWEVDGVIYSVTSVLNTLSKNELLKVAESLGK